MGLETYSGEVPRWLQDPAELTPDTSWDEVWDSSWNLESPGGGYGREAFDPIPDASEDDVAAVNNGTFRSLDYLAETHPDLDNETLYEYFAPLNNRAQVDWKAKNLRKEISWIRTNEAAPFYKTAITDTASGFASPSVLLELAGVAIGWGKIPLYGAKRAAMAAGFSIPATALDEFMLWQQQDLRTGWQSGAALIGAAGITGSVAALTGKRVVKLNPDLSAIPNTNLPPSALRPEVTPSPAIEGQVSTSGGAAQRIVDISQDDMNAIMDVPTQVELDAAKELRDAGVVFNDKYGPDYDGPVTTEAQRTVAIKDKQGENYQVLRPTVVKIAGMGLHKILPDVSAALSNNPVIRRAGAYINNTNLDTVGSRQGKGIVGVDSVAMRGDTDIETGVSRIYSGAYTEYTKSFKGDGKLSRADFYREIQYAVAAGNKHDIPAVTKAATEVYGEFILPMGRRGVSGGHLTGKANGDPVSPLGDVNYYTRSFSGGYARRVDKHTYARGLMEPYKIGLAKRVQAEAAESARLVNELNTKTLPELEARLNEAINAAPDSSKELRYAHKKEVAKLKRDAKKTPLAKELGRLDDPKSKVYKKQYKRLLQMHKEVANEIRASGTGEYSGNGVTLDVQGELQLTSSRTLDIPTELLPRDYLDPDAMMGIINSLKRMNRQMLVDENKAVFGDATFKNFREDLFDYHNGKIEAAKGDTKATKKLELQFKKDKIFLDKLIQDYYGMKPPPASEMLYNLGAKAKALNAINGLGSVIISTLPELASMLRTAGVRGYLRHTVGRVLSPTVMKDMSRSMKADYVLGVEQSMGNRMLEAGEYDSGMSASTRFMHKAADVAVDKVYMLGVWTRAMSTTAGVIIQSKLGRMMLKKELSPRDISDLGHMGLNIDMLDALRTEVGKHHVKAWGGAVDMNIAKWGNTTLRDDVVNAIASEVQNTIIRPGTGATPFIGNTMSGSLLLQFKQFLLASTSKYWMADMQKLAMGDYRAAERQLAFVGLGTMVAGLKANYLYSDRARERWDDMDIAEKMFEGFKHGGGGGFAAELLGYAGEILNPGSIRYAGNRNLVNQGIGPSLNLAVDGLNMATGLSSLIKDGTITREHLKSFRRNIPGNSFVLTRPMVNQAEGDLYEVLNK